MSVIRTCMNQPASSKHRVAVLAGEESDTYRDAIVACNLPELEVARDDAVADCDILIGEPQRVRSVLTEAHNLLWVQSTWAGVSELLDQRTDYLLTGVKNVFADDMAEYVFCYLLMHAREVRGYAMQQSRAVWQPRSTMQIARRTLGVMGLGSIGARIAEVGRQFGLNTLGLRASASPHPAVERVFGPDELHTFLAECDYVVCTLPDTRQTRGLLDARAFRAAKPGCYFVNVGRATTVVESALVNALTSGVLSGAVLDVVSEEPLPVTSALWHAPNLVVTPHIAAPTRVDDVVPIFADNYERWHSSEPLLYEIDWARGY